MSFATLYDDICAQLAKKGIVLSAQAPSRADWWQQTNMGWAVIKEWKFEGIEAYVAKFMHHHARMLECDAETKDTKWVLTVQSYEEAKEFPITIADWEDPPKDKQIFLYVLTRYERMMTVLAHDIIVKCGTLLQTWDAIGPRRPTGPEFIESRRWLRSCPTSITEMHIEKEKCLDVIAEAFCKTYKEANVEGSIWQLGVTLDVVSNSEQKKQTDSGTELKSEAMFVFQLICWDKQDPGAPCSACGILSLTSHKPTPCSEAGCKGCAHMDGMCETCWLASK